MDAGSINELPLTPPHYALSSIDQPADLQKIAARWWLETKHYFPPYGSAVSSAD
jgi:hypothetical protein